MWQKKCWHVPRNVEQGVWRLWLGFYTTSNESRKMQFNTFLNIRGSWPLRCSNEWLCYLTHSFTKTSNYAVLPKEAETNAQCNFQVGPLYSHYQILNLWYVLNRNISISTWEELEEQCITLKSDSHQIVREWATKNTTASSRAAK